MIEKLEKSEINIEKKKPTASSILKKKVSLMS
jgi:hypothetical protein